MPRKPERPNASEEYRFKIDAYTPATMPMLRLAEYMQELARILGEADRVHFRRLRRGSTVIVHSVDREAIPKVRGRVSQVRRGEGPTEALRAYKAMNRMLRDDNATGTLRAGALILAFPGRSETQEEFASVRQQGFIDGIITSVRGADETIHILLQAEGKQISGCHTNRSVGKQLGARFLEPVRLFGRGRWQRDADGNWELIDFKIESFETLDDAPLSDALAKMRAIPTEWGDNAYRELEEARHGPKRNGNGGH